MSPLCPPHGLPVLEVPLNACISVEVWLIKPLLNCIDCKVQGFKI